MVLRASVRPSHKFPWQISYIDEFRAVTGTIRILFDEFADRRLSFAIGCGLVDIFSAALVDEKSVFTLSTVGERLGCPVVMPTLIHQARARQTTLIGLGEFVNKRLLLLDGLILSWDEMSVVEVSVVRELVVVTSHLSNPGPRNRRFC